MESVSSCTEEQEAGYNPNIFLETYFSDKTVLNKHEIFWFPLHNLQQVFKPGFIKRKVLVSIGFGPVLYQLFSSCEFFEEVYIGTATELDVTECKKWLTKEPGCFDWTPAEREVCTSEGDLEKWAEKERRLRESVKQCLTFDFSQSNPFDPVVLPAADCLILYFFLASSSRDGESFVDNLKKCVAQLKDGGNLVILGAMGMTYFTIGQHHFPCFSYNEQLLRETLDNVGCDIQVFNTIPRADLTNTTYTDHKGFVCVVASKKGTA
ncbi:nicotinamide N-methyltransferase-like [Ambystoma mexicanum]|uniref:nicotinamide N-methyltransferase-like n=1 Tax=Ambystoma mexicanum TaxID=8296 RepID=UPI0037E7A272